MLKASVVLDWVETWKSVGKEKSVGRTNAKRGRPADTTTASDQDANAKPPPFEVSKEYPLRGGALQQFRFTATTAFTCDRCGKRKRHGWWSREMGTGESFCVTVVMASFSRTVHLGPRSSDRSC